MIFKKYLKLFLAVNQILTHWYTTVLLSLRYQFHEARACIVSGVYNAIMFVSVLIGGKHGPLGGDALLKHKPIYWDSGSLVLHTD